MKKRMAMAVMALAVSAMAGSAFAANEPGKTTKATKAMETVTIKPADGIKPMERIQTIAAASLKIADQVAKDVKMMKVIHLEDLAKEKGITVVDLKVQLEKEGRLAPAVKLVPAAPVQK